MDTPYSVITSLTAALVKKSATMKAGRVTGFDTMRLRCKYVSVQYESYRYFDSIMELSPSAGLMRAYDDSVLLSTHLTDPDRRNAQSG